MESERIACRPNSAHWPSEKFPPFSILCKRIVHVSDVLRNIVQVTCDRSLPPSLLHIYEEKPLLSQFNFRTGRGKREQSQHVGFRSGGFGRFSTGKRADTRFSRLRLFDQVKNEIRDPISADVNIPHEREGEMERWRISGSCCSQRAKQSRTEHRQSNHGHISHNRNRKLFILFHLQFSYSPRIQCIRCGGTAKKKNFFLSNSLSIDSIRWQWTWIAQ